MTFYAIRHLTRFTYSAPVRESVMELRMQPRSEGPQTLRSFQIATNPRAQLYAYTDHLGNAVYHFNVLRRHSELGIEVNATVEMDPVLPPPEAADAQEWQRYNDLNLTPEHYDFLMPSKFAHSCETLDSFVAEHALKKPADDPLSALRRLSKIIHDSFEYEIGVTEVHSPISHALELKRGVCQDFAHIMIAVARAWGVPSRYVSGYLVQGGDKKDRSSEDATHAWVESYLPSFGWLGFDPTNDIMAADRHVRVAVGRDYADVPPTRGTFKGEADSELAIAVSVTPAQAPQRHEEFLRVSRQVSRETPAPAKADTLFQQQQQQ